MSGDEMERHLSLSLGEPEQLRRNMTPASEGNLYVGDGTPGSYGGDEQMDAPPDDMIPQLDSMARPPSVQVDSYCSSCLVMVTCALLDIRSEAVYGGAYWSQCKELTSTDRAKTWVQEEDMHVEDALPAPFSDDLGANLDNLLPSRPEDV